MIEASLVCLVLTSGPLCHEEDVLQLNIQKVEEEKRESLKMNHLVAIPLNILIILDIKFKIC